jgi:hypothetical protein
MGDVAGMDSDMRAFGWKRNTEGGAKILTVKIQPILLNFMACIALI